MARMVASSAAIDMFALNVQGLTTKALIEYMSDSTIDWDIMQMARTEYLRRIESRPNVCGLHMDDRSVKDCCPCYAAAFAADARWA